MWAFERFGVSTQLEPRQATSVEELLEEASADVQIRWGGFSGNHQDGVNSISQVKGELRFGAHLCLLVGSGEGSANMQWYLLALLFKERAALPPAPPVLSLKLINSVYPHMILTFLRCCSRKLRASEFVSKQVHVRAP